MTNTYTKLTYFCQEKNIQYSSQEGGGALVKGKALKIEEGEKCLP
jgi:hypothetical protein